MHRARSAPGNRPGSRRLGWVAFLLATAVAGAPLTDWASLILFGSDALTHVIQQNVEYIAEVWVAVVAVGWHAPL